MRIKKTSLVIFLVNILLIQNVHGKYADEFYANGVGARPLGLGGAFVSFEGDLNSVFWNPAGISAINSFGISLMHSEQFGGELMFDHFSVLQPVSDFTLGFSYIRSNVDEIFDTRKAGSFTETNLDSLDKSKITEFADTDQLFSFAFGRKWNDKLSFGANFKIIHRSVAEFSAKGFGIDVGGIYKVRENWRVGANLQNATTTVVSWNKGNSKEFIRPLLKLGTSYDYKLKRNRFTFALDTDNRLENRDYSAQFNVSAFSTDFRFGLEYAFAEAFFLRFGYDDVERMNFGAGFKIAKYFTIDYAVTEGGQSAVFGRSHRISLNFQR
ncbi:PorV/PorQ family protein [bacterium]|nr:PorV/PorQ family protein [bacterium]